MLLLALKLIHNTLYFYMLWHILVSPLQHLLFSYLNYLMQDSSVSLHLEENKKITIIFVKLAVILVSSNESLLRSFWLYFIATSSVNIAWYVLQFRLHLPYLISESMRTIKKVDKGVETRAYAYKN